MTQEDKQSIEHLLKPRYKVIAIYPFNDHFMLNEVIVLNEFDNRNHLDLQEHFVIQKPLSTAGNIMPITFFESTFDKFPHLFKKLAWYEEREGGEMPHYVSLQTIEGTKAYKAKFNVEESSPYFMWLDDQVLPYHPHGFQPATQSEYLTYINKKP